jgi:NTP pyrophosphatase (non-canonical NTP hydrolase)
MASAPRQSAPFPTGPITDASGELADAWRSFMLAIYNRGGGSSGISPDAHALASETQRAETAEAVLRAGQLAQTAAIDAEAASRETADAAEVINRNTAIYEAVAIEAGARASTNFGLPLAAASWGM